MSYNKFKCFTVAHNEISLIAKDHIKIQIRNNPCIRT